MKARADETAKSREIVLSNEQICNKCSLRRRLSKSYNLAKMIVDVAELSLDYRR